MYLHELLWWMTDVSGSTGARDRLILRTACSRLLIFSASDPNLFFLTPYRPFRQGCDLEL